MTDFDTPFDLDAITEELRQKENEIIDLFCKTFLIAHKPETAEDIKRIFEQYELVEIRSYDHNFIRYSFELREKIQGEISVSDALAKINEKHHVALE